MANAFIAGDRPMRTFEKINMGKVVEPGPVRKLAMTRSSNENVNASSQPDSSALKINGILIFKNTVNGLAPRFMAASSKDLSSDKSLALTVI